MHVTRRTALGAMFGTALGATLAGDRPAQAQAKTTVTLSRQPGILYLASHVIEKQGLIEKQAASAGLPGLKTNWVNVSGGGAQTDALLAGGVDVVNTGTGNLLLLWERTRGRVRGICATSAQPLLLVSRDPRIKALGDFRAGDKIAVPTVKVSTQAILLQMACAQAYGDAEYARLDANTVQLGHPDAVAIMANPNAEVSSHFSAPPFQYRELRTVPGAHTVLQSPDIIGGPLSQAQFFTTTAFADANPAVIKAVRAATEEAIAFIRADRKGAVAIYREVTGDPMAANDVLAVLDEPGMMEFNLPPQGTMKFAAHLHKIGTLKTMPSGWKDYYLPIAADLDGS